MVVNKATVMELYEVVRRLQEVVINNKRRIEYLEREVEELRSFRYRIYKLEVQMEELKEESKKRKEFKK